MPHQADIIIPVSVLMERTVVRDNLWIDFNWQASGVIPTQTADADGLIFADVNTEIYRFSGFKLEIERDELESYYQNLSSKQACVFVVCHADEYDTPTPFITTLSYDEAASYMETDEPVYSVGIDVAIYQQIEHYVLTHYEHKPIKKRRRSMGSAGDTYQKEPKND